MSRIPVYIVKMYESGVFACNAATICGQQMRRDFKLKTAEDVEQTIKRMYADLEARTTQALQQAHAKRGIAERETRLKAAGANGAYDGVKTYGYHPPRNVSLESTTDFSLSHMAPDTNPSTTGGKHGGIVQQGIV